MVRLDEAMFDCVDMASAVERMAAEACGCDVVDVAHSDGEHHA
jgi:hypothetical protein